MSNKSKILIGIILLALVGFGAFLFSSNSDEDLASQSQELPTPNENPKTNDTETMAYCNGILEGELLDGWVVEEVVGNQVGIVQQQCEIHRDDTNFEISVSEVVGTEEELTDINQLGVQIGGQIIVDRDEMLVMSDGTEATVFSNSISGGDSSADDAGQVNYSVRTSPTRAISFFYTRMAEEPADSVVDTLIQSLTIVK